MRVLVGLLAMHVGILSLVGRLDCPAAFDLSTYMEQALLVNQGERDYYRIQGATGPVAYPGGHLLLFEALRRRRLSNFIL